jgi:hypothetical protein
MAVDADDYRDRSVGSEFGRRLERHEDRVRDAHTNSHLARLLSILALIMSAIALWTALNALNKATDALNLANRNLDAVQSLQRNGGQ